MVFLSDFLAPHRALVPFLREGAKLVGRMVLYCWPDVGWCKGKIISVNTDGRFKVGGAKVNFIIYYEVDDDNSKHALSLAAFGEDKDWVLLEKA